MENTPLKWLAISQQEDLQSDMSQFQLQWQNICCNPFNKPNHFITKKNQLRVVTKRICEKVPSILPGEKICDSCRKQLAAESERQSLPKDILTVSQSLMWCLPLIKCLGIANEHLDAVGETPLAHLFRQELWSKRYRRQKLESLQQ